VKLHPADYSVHDEAYANGVAHGRGEAEEAIAAMIEGLVTGLRRTGEAVDLQNAAGLAVLARWIRGGKHWECAKEIGK
jgi:hypothetical protein